MDGLYHYTDCGLPDIYLDGVKEVETPFGKGTSIPALENLHLAIGCEIAKANRGMTGAEFRFLRTELDLSQSTLSKMLDVQENTVRRWEHGETKIPGPAQRAIAGYYLETMTEDGRLRDIMQRLAETDRELAGLRLELERVGESWTAKAA